MGILSSSSSPLSPFKSSSKTLQDLKIRIHNSKSASTPEEIQPSMPLSLSSFDTQSAIDFAEKLKDAMTTNLLPCFGRTRKYKIAELVFDADAYIAHDVFRKGNASLSNFRTKDIKLNIEPERQELLTLSAGSVGEMLETDEDFEDEDLGLGDRDYRRGRWGGSDEGWEVVW